MDNNNLAKIPQINSRENSYAGKNAIIEDFIFKEIECFLSFTSFAAIPENEIVGDWTLLKRIIAAITKRNVSQVSREVIEDEFMPVRRYIFKCGLSKPY